MPQVWNPTKETISTKMQGSWFTFKPDAKKNMDNDKCQFINEMRKETGLVVLPAEFDPLSDNYVEGYEKTDEGKAILAVKAEEGIANLVAYHKDIIKNNQVALRKDMARANPVGDAARLIALEMSDGERKSLELVARYKRADQDANDKRIKEVESLLEQVGPVGE